MKLELKVTRDTDGQIGVTNNAGEWIIPASYHNILIGEELIIARLNQGNFIYDYRGEIRFVIYGKCLQAKHLTGVYYLVKCEDEEKYDWNKYNWGIVNCRGQEIIPTEYETILSTDSKDVWIVKEPQDDYGWGVVNSRMDFIIPTGKYKKIIPRQINNGIINTDVFYAVNEDGAIDIIDYTGTILVPYSLTEIEENIFGKNSEYIMVYEGDNYRMLNTTNWKLSFSQFQKYSRLTEDYILTIDGVRNLYDIYNYMGKKINEDIEIVEIINKDEYGNISVLCKDGEKRTIHLEKRRK